MAGCDVGREIRSRLSRYTPGSFENQQGHRFTKVCIQLFGMAGHGKSSLINSCSCVMKDEDYLNVAGSGKSLSPNTMERKEHRLSECVFITDNRGVVKLNLDELHEMTAQMIQLRTMGSVEWERSVDRSSDVLLRNYRNPPPEILLPVFVYSVDYEWSSKRSDELRPFLSRAKDIAGISPVIVLTRSGNPRTPDIYKEFRTLGAEIVLAVENYTTSNRVRSPEKDNKILKFLEGCLKEVDQLILKTIAQDPKEQLLRQYVRQVQSEINDKAEEIKQLMLKQKSQKKFRWIR